MGVWLLLTNSKSVHSTRPRAAPGRDAPPPLGPGLHLFGPARVLRKPQRAGRGRRRGRGRHIRSERRPREYRALAAGAGVGAEALRGPEPGARRVSSELRGPQTEGRERAGAPPPPGGARAAERDLESAARGADAVAGLPGGVLGALRKIQ